jgi:hypothetical protein
MKLKVTFTQDQLEEALKEIIWKKLKNEEIKFDKFDFRVISNDFALNRGPDKTEATVTIDIF